MSKAVIIGKLRPFHNGHTAIFTRAFQKYDAVLALVGSINQPRTPQLPWIFQEVSEMIHLWHEKNIKPKYPSKPLIVEGVRDFYLDEKWVASVQEIVDNRLGRDDVYLVGADKDETTYYLKLFPTFKKDIVNDHEISTFQVNATKIRNLYFSEPEAKFYSGEVSVEVSEFLEKWKTTPFFQKVLDEFNYYKRYKEEWSSAPYPPTFVTVDSVVIQGGHILLIQRRTEPGKGLFALPGGFINPTESLLQSAIRELMEETKIDLTPNILYGCLRNKDNPVVFDKPGRSLRGRVITNTFLFKLSETGKLPKVKGGSDARRAHWIPLSSLKNMEHMMFEDHPHIIQRMIGIL